MSRTKMDDSHLRPMQLFYCPLHNNSHCGSGIFRCVQAEGSSQLPPSFDSAVERICLRRKTWCTLTMQTEVTGFVQGRSETHCSF